MKKHLVNPCTSTLSNSFKGDIRNVFHKSLIFPIWVKSKTDSGKCSRNVRRNVSAWACPSHGPWSWVMNGPVCVRLYSMCDYMWVYMNNICLVLSVGDWFSRKGSFLSVRQWVKARKQTGGHVTSSSQPLVIQFNTICGLERQSMLLIYTHK